ncbi:MAG: AzlC family ABC transporter permease [Eubacterium sp.]|nr:AzlC family ABC transporter permease [Eubacterium sp.]
MNRKEFLRGAKNGMPIALGYFAVSITIGIAAANAGLSVFESGLTSCLCFTSTGEFAGIGLIAEAGSYLQAAVLQLIINARYVLMSASLSQKLKEDVPLRLRLLTGMGVTDEIFGLSIAEEYPLSPFYTIGIVSVAVPGWTLGTVIGALLGGILPELLTCALSVSLYGMFISAFIPPAKKDRKIAALVVCSFIASLAFSLVPVLKEVSESTKIIVLTIVLSAAFALIFPVKEKDEIEEGQE